MELNIKFLGVGDAFSIKHFHSNMLLTFENGEKLLVDAGSDLKRSLHAHNISPEEIDMIYISHTHGDHCGGLEWLGFYLSVQDLKKPILFLPEEVHQYLWPHVLSGAMATGSSSRRSIHDYFDVFVMQDNFIVNGIRFDLLPMCHLMTSYGLSIAPVVGGDPVIITTDTNKPVDPKLAAKAKLIFHDCCFGPPNPAHVNAQTIRGLDNSIKKKLCLYHYGDDPHIDDTMTAVLGVNKIVKQGEEFIISW